jgi:amino acid transporter
VTADSSAVGRALARNRLGWKTLGGFVLAAAAPLTVVAGGVTNGWAVTGLLGIPAAYWMVAILLALFAAGYTALSQRLPNAGAFYTFLVAGLGRVVGIACGLVALVAYCSMQIGLYGGLGPVGAEEINTVFGVSVSWQAMAAIGLVLIGLCGVLRVDFNGAVLGVLLLVEVAVILVIDVVEIVTHPGGPITATSVSPSTVFSGGILGLVALVIALTGFVGFEDGPNYTEESRPRAPMYAVFASLAITLVLYTGSSWAMTVAAGPDHVVSGSKKYSTDFMFHLVDGYVPAVVLDIAHLLFITSLFAAGLSFHNTFNRYVFSLSRDRVLPYGLSRTWHRFRSPAFASLLQTGIAAVVLLIVGVSGADPLTALFFDGTVFAGFGVLLLMTACCVAIVVYFARYRRGESVWRVFVCPILAGVGLATTVVVSVIYFGTLMGVANGSTLARVLPALYGGVVVVGVVIAAVLRATRADRYRQVGRAGDDTYQALRRDAANQQPTSDAIVLGGDT